MQDTVFSDKKGAFWSYKKPHLSQPVVMGIMNLTPDSFYDGGRYKTEKEVLEHVEQMLSEEASIIDLGAASTRPGAELVSREEELKRLLPFLKIIRKTFPQAVLSIDTYYSGTAAAAVSEGADIINDVSGGTIDAGMFETVGFLKKPYVLMHMQETPLTMQQNPVYEDVVAEVKLFFEKNITELNKKGVTDIILDPGFGFGKTLEHNFALLKNLGEIKALGYPILVGISRKSMVNKALGIKPDKALNGTSILNTVALLNGADILRVHDVKEAVEAVKLVSKCQ